MAKTRKVYWDACAWLGLVNGESKKLRELEIVWKMAERGEVQIWTSTLSLAEVYKTKCERESRSLFAEHDARIDNMFDQSFVEKVQVDTEIARSAKNLARAHQLLKKPTDAIHLASAIAWNVDELHTYDGSDLLGLNGVIHREDGEMLTICMPDHLTDGALFAGTKDIREPDA